MLQTSLGPNQNERMRFIMGEAHIDAFKACRKCGLEKSFDCYHFSISHKKLSDLCVTCRRARDAGYYQKHIDKKKERVRKYKADNPDKVRAWHREWSKRNPERVAEFGKAYRAKFKDSIYARQLRWIEENKDHVRALSRKNYHANIERTTEYYRQWREQNRSRLNELARAQYQKDKAKVKAAKHQRRIGNGSGLSFTKADLERILEEQCGTCRYCDSDIAETYEIDHFIPIARGGGNEPENIVLACMPCNRSKGAKLPWVWRPHLFS